MLRRTILALTPGSDSRRARAVMYFVSPAYESTEYFIDFGSSLIYLSAVRGLVRLHSIELVSQRYRVT